MSRIGNAASAMKLAAEIHSNTLRSNLFVQNPMSCGNTTLRSCAVNLIQKRHRHVMDDAMEPHRTLNHDKKTGVKASSEIILKKFFRLRWGAWIRGVQGKDSDDMWKKDLTKQRHYKKHVFCTAKQSTKFDKMTTWDVKEPHYYVDDPYEPYHNKEEFLLTRTKPLPPSKNVYQHLDD